MGYKGDDARYSNYDKQNNYRLSSSEHGDMFEPINRDFFGPIIVQEVDNAA